MANWCSNTVVFTGGQNQLDELKTLFLTMAKKEQKERKGQLPPFVNDDTGYLFEIRWEEDVLYYETKWSPNTEVMVQVADKYHTGFEHSYSESGNGVFGETTYEDGILEDVFLDDDDYDLYGYDEETEIYFFENQAYESNEEIHDILLERKKAIKSIAK